MTHTPFTQFVPYAIVAMGVGAVFLLTTAAMPHRTALTRRIEKLDAPSDRRELIIQQIVNSKASSTLAQRLAEAGWYGVTPAAMKIRGFVAMGVGGVLGLILAMLVHGGILGLILGGFFTLVAWRFPAIGLSRAIKLRKEELGRELPDFLDLLSTTVQAGLALNAAMLQAADATFGALREELYATLTEVKLGRSRSEALIALADRVNEPAVRTMVTAIVQAEKLGSNLGGALQELAKDTRDRRWILAEERAAKLPVTMIIPMALFMLPSLYLMIFGPVAALLLRPHT